jgi:hypothetical protein
MDEKRDLCPDRRVRILQLEIDRDLPDDVVEITRIGEIDPFCLNCRDVSTLSTRGTTPSLGEL